MSIMFGSLFLVGLAIALCVAWQFGSRRIHIPCPVWLGWLVEQDNPFTKVNRAQTIIKHLNVHPGMHILDAGCGPGRLTIPLASKVGPHGLVVALDMQSGMLTRVQEKAQAANLTNIKRLNAKLGDGKLPHDHFDCALLVCVLGEIPNQKLALQELFNSLKPGGVLSITEVIFDPHFQSQATVKKLLATTGFIGKNIFGNRIAYTMHAERPKSTSY